MSKKQRLEQKAAIGFMKVVVTICIITLIVFAVGAYVSAWYSVNTVPVLQVVAAVFGGELLLTVVLKLIQRGEPKNDKEGKG